MFGLFTLINLLKELLAETRKQTGIAEQQLEVEKKQLASLLKIEKQLSPPQAAKFIPTVGTPIAK